MSNYLHGIDVVTARDVLATLDEVEETFAADEALDEGVLPNWAPPTVEEEVEAVALPGSLLTPFVGEEAFEPSKQLKSEISGVSNEGWTAFARAMQTAQPTAVSASGALGMFELKPRRLEDLGLMKLRRGRQPGTRHVVWKGDFVEPLTQEMFLGKPTLQYRAFADSMKQYIKGLRDGSIPRPSTGIERNTTLSGVLAILHKCGPSGLETWCQGDRFPSTQALFDKANGIF